MSCTSSSTYIRQPGYHAYTPIESARPCTMCYYLTIYYALCGQLPDREKLPSARLGGAAIKQLELVDSTLLGLSRAHTPLCTASMQEPQSVPCCERTVPGFAQGSCALPASPAAARRGSGRFESWRTTVAHCQQLPQKTCNTSTSTRFVRSDPLATPPSTATPEAPFPLSHPVLLSRPSLFSPLPSFSPFPSFSAPKPFPRSPHLSSSPPYQKR